MFIGAVYNGINLPASFESFIFVREAIRSLFYSNLEVNGTQRISWLAKEKRETYGAEENREKCLISIDESRRFFQSLSRLSSCWRGGNEDSTENGKESKAFSPGLITVCKVLPKFVRWTCILSHAASAADKIVLAWVARWSASRSSNQLKHKSSNFWFLKSHFSSE